jgi:hypothetical protein
MPDVTVVEIFAPFRSEQRVPALRAGNNGSGPMKSASSSRSKLHDVSSVSLFPLATLPHADDRIVTTHTADVKQRR